MEKISLGRKHTVKRVRKDTSYQGSERKIAMYNDPYLKFINQKNYTN